MNCAESQDLLLDLAYGELPPARAAEVQAHMLDCASCRVEKAQLDDARKAAAPLRDLEEPPAGFDEPILRAARAEAGMQADGTPGPVVEVSASVKPLGLQAARLDPHARMRGGAERSRPHWWRRAAVVGSIAAAAGLAVVVTTSITNRASRPAVPEEVAPIQVRAPGAPVPTSVDHAVSAADERAARPESKRRVASGEAPPPQPAPAPAAPKKEANAQPAKVKNLLRDRQVPSAMEKDRYGAVGSFAGRGQSEPAAPAQAPQSDALAAQRSARADAQTVPAAMAKAAPATPDQLEDQASAARRRGDYARAASLYREASALRMQSEPARAAWDIAHAVECLAAGGQVDEAVAVRKELLRRFPDHAGPKAAADSALRSMRLPPDDDPSVK